MSRSIELFTLGVAAILAASACAQTPAQTGLRPSTAGNALGIDEVWFQDADYRADVEEVAEEPAPEESEFCEAPTECQQPLCDCLWCRDHLLGDLHGARSSLAEHGIIWDGQLTQFHQGVVDGGNEQTFRYGGKLDQFVIINFAQMGICQHLTGIMHVESRFGDTVIPDAVLLAPVNANMLYPELNENDTAITGLQFELALTDQLSAVAGKFNAFDFLNLLYPETGRGVDGFMNVSMFTPLTIGRTLPLSFLGAGLMKKQGQQVQGGVLVYDSNNITTTSGFDVLFDNGANVIGFWRFFTDHGGLPGSHAVIGTYAGGDYTALDPLGWAIIPGQGVVAPQVAGSWSVEYIYQQKLWMDACNPKRNVGLLSEWGYADPDTNPFEWVANVGIQAQGLSCCRENDVLGVGYFYSGLSGNVKNLLQGVAPIDDVQGMEVYYKAEITPWFHVTADLQVIEPGLQANDTAVVFGLRGKIEL